MIEIDDLVKYFFMGAVGLVFWVLRSNAVKLNKVMIDIAVIKSIIDCVREDHDAVIKLSDRFSTFETKTLTDLKNTNDRIRSIYNG